MVDPGKLADIFSNEQEMERLIDGLHKIERGVSAIAEKVIGLNTDVQTGTDAVKKAVEEVNSSFERTTDKVEDLTESSERLFSLWDKFSQKARGIFQDLGAASTNVGVLMSRLQSSPESTVMHGVRNIPYVGPLLEVALESQFREDRFKTAGRQTAMQFGRSENLDPAKIREQGALIGADMKRLEESFLASKEEVQAVWGAFVEGGAKSADVTKRVNFEVQGFGNTVSQVSLGLDKAFQMAAGSTAQFATALTKDTGQGLERTVELVKDLGLASHATGTTMQGFVGTILQVTGALRTQGGDARDLANAYLNVQKSFAGALGSDVKNPHVAELAAGAVGGLPQFVQGMPEGLKAIVGMRIARDLGKPMGDLAALRQMQTGFQFAGVGKTDFEQRSAEGAYGELSSRIKDPNELFRALTQVAGMPALLAEAMVQTQGKMFQGDEFKKEREKYEGKLKEVQNLEPLKKGDFEKVMADIQNLMHSLGQLTVATLQLIIQVLVSGFRAIMPGSKFGASDFMRDVNARSLAVGDAFSDVAAHGKRLGLDTNKALGITNFWTEAEKKDQIVGGSLQEQEARAVEELLASRKGDKFADQFRSALKQSGGKSRGALELFGGALNEEDRRVINKTIQDVDDRYEISIRHIKPPKNTKLVPRGDMPPIGA